MINQRIFSANVGEPSTGNKGPDAIEQDIDNLLANDQELLGITGSKANLTTDDKTNLVAAINDLDANKANKAQPTWIAATLQNGWTGSLHYRKNQIGQFEMNGSLTAGVQASNTIITTFPVEFRTSRYASIPFLNNTRAKLSNGIGLNNFGELKVINPGHTEMTTGDTIIFDVVLI